MKNVVAIVFVLALALASLSGGGANAQRIQNIYGDGTDLLVFDGAPDEHGLTWQIHEPNRSSDHWALTVRNDTGRTISNVVASIWYQVDGQWYLSGMDNSKMFMMPATIPPGGVGMSVGAWLGGRSTDWRDVRVQDVEFSEGESDTIVMMRITEISPSGRNGALVNDTPYSVTHVGVRVTCVLPSGRIVDDFHNGIDLRKMDPGESESFQFSTANGDCGEDESPIIYAAGRIRD